VAALTLVLTALAWTGCDSKKTTPRTGPKPTILDRLTGQTVEVEVTDVKPPPDPFEGVLTDDRIEDKTPSFDPGRVDRRLLEGFQVNASAAVLRLDVPMIRPDYEPELLVIHASYRAAIDAAGSRRGRILPSVNLIDGAAKQFDDGLYAALELAHTNGLNDRLRGHIDLMGGLLAKVGPNGPAAPFLAAALELAGAKTDVKIVDDAEMRRLLAEFEADPLRSKPIGFHTWSPELERTFRFLRFLMRPLEADGPIAKDLADALAKDEQLRADHKQVIAFYAKLGNPPTPDLGLVGDPGPARFVALLPASTSREAELFARLFPTGVPADVSLMRELIARIRSGEVDLKPRPGSGWYDHQVYALETMLLPERAPENDRLLLTAGYKRRMLEAFAALITKRKETHAMEAVTSAEMLMDEVIIRPRPRVEPAPTYYLRTARAYAFLADFLESRIGAEGLSSLHGLRDGGLPVGPDLGSELRAIRDRFYGLHLLSSEDIGAAPALADDEPVDRDACETIASDWLARFADDPDLARDTRVSVPVFVDPTTNTTRLWATLGVRLARLETGYVWPRVPRLRAEGAAEWKTPSRDQIEDASYLIPVDEFAEVELKGRAILSREELRSICDREKSRDAILKALEGR
jgi:hypothetical protein